MKCDGGLGEWTPKSNTTAEMTARDAAQPVDDTFMVAGSDRTPNVCMEGRIIETISAVGLLRVPGEVQTMFAVEPHG